MALKDADWQHVCDTIVANLSNDALDDLANRLYPRLAGRLLEDPWIDAKQAAEYLGTTTSSLWKLTAAREIPFEQDKPGGKLWFKRSQLDAWRSD